MSRRRTAGLLAALVTAVTAMSGSMAISASAATGDPALNVAPSPDYWPTCANNGETSDACNSAVVTAINHARALEGVKPMVLPAGFGSLSAAVQIFVVSNLERVDRGLKPAAGTVGTLNSSAQTAATHDADPTLSSWTVGPFSANRWGSNWAGDLNALAADYDWMYNDGWGPGGSSNLDCTASGAAGCWGHRHNILSTYGGEELITGVGSTPQSQWTSFAQIFVAGSGPYPPFVTSWSEFSASSAQPPAGGPTPDGSDPTASSVTVTPRVVSGRTGTVTGHVTDTATGLPVAGVEVLLCHRTAIQATGSCTPAVTGLDGVVRHSLHLILTTTWWVAFPGGTGLAASSSSLATMHVLSGVTLRPVHTTTGWGLRATFTPVRGQVIRLMRLDSLGKWVTIRKTTVRHSAMLFTRVGHGHFRMAVAAARGLLANSAYTAIR